MRSRVPGRKVNLMVLLLTGQAHSPSDVTADSVVRRFPPANPSGIACHHKGCW